MKSFLYYVSSVYLLFITVVLAGCGHTQESTQGTQPAKQMVPVVQVASVVRSTISRNLELTGSVEPYRIARLASPAEGPVANVLVRVGDRVQVNQQLLSIGRKQGIDALTASLKEELKKEADNLQCWTDGRRKNPCTDKAGVTLLTQARVNLAKSGNVDGLPGMMISQSGTNEKPGSLDCGSGGVRHFLMLQCVVHSGPKM